MKLRNQVHLVASVLLAACAGSTATFHPTDPSFTPSPRESEPSVYVNEPDVPHVELRSVGVIEVSGQDGRSKAAARAKEIGCWALVEHELFERMHGSRAPRPSSDRSSDSIFLHGHGGVHPVAAVRTPTISRFDCVVPQAQQSPRASVIM